MTNYLPNGYCQLKKESDSGYYIINDVIGRGASTIAYNATYKNSEGLSQERIIKEFFPNYIKLKRLKDGQIVYDEKEKERFEKARENFIIAGKVQNDLRNRATLMNQTPPVREMFCANGTYYLDVTPYAGTLFSFIEKFTYLERIRIFPLEILCHTPKSGLLPNRRTHLKLEEYQKSQMCIHWGK